MMGSLPPPGTSPTCDTAGVLGSITYIVASIQSAEAIKLLVDEEKPSELALQTYDVWKQRFQRTSLDPSLMSSCPVCSERHYEYLEGTPLRTITLCGRNAVQLIPAIKADLNLPALSTSMRSSGEVQVNDFLLKCSSPPYELTLFKDGRAIIRGTEEASVARSVYSKLIGV
jgi:adenylyltransferase/sulfurtransferase